MATSRGLEDTETDSDDPKFSRRRTDNIQGSKDRAQHMQKRILNAKSVNDIIDAMFENIRDQFNTNI